MPKKKKTKLTWFFLIIGKAILDLFKYIFLGIFYFFRAIWQILMFPFERKQKDEEEKDLEETEKNKKSKLNLDFLKPNKKPKKEICNIHHKKTVKGYFTDFRKRLDTDSLIISIVGRRGSGKSALGFSLLENISAKTKRRAFVMGVDQKLIPKWIDSVEDIEEVDNGGLLLIDEGAISFSSRESMSKKNRQLGKLLAIARHKDLTLIFITQNTGMMDKNVLNLTDTLIFKEGSLLQEKMERRAMKDFYEKSSKELNKIPKDKRKAYSYVFDDEFEGLIKTDLPSFWSSKVSKSHKK
jgi:hypothetical protein